MSSNFILIFIIISCLLLSSTPSIAYPVKINVLNNATDPAGRRRFDKELGKEYTVKILTEEIIPFIWKTFNQPTDASRKYVPNVGFIVKTLTDGAMAEIGEDNIYYNDIAIRDLPAGQEQAKFFFKSVVYHEATHIYQFNGKGTAPGGLTEGIADYVMVKSKVYNPEGYTKPGEGSKWDEGYGVTTRFLEYCDSLKPGFTPTLNNKMKDVFKEDYFQELIGKPLAQLWREYKAKYRKIILDGSFWEWLVRQEQNEGEREGEGEKPVSPIGFQRVIPVSEKLFRVPIPVGVEVQSDEPISNVKA
ncbi:uncharacterized protein LOC127252866 [Andrographis paniculata]|uniref:uncharacterized protein LOC127252866 n=1 Tax=Andrographis paniculata TaxID=175694 RepID=UPI0021E87348|nr:uncharacterized protein LOC127252866 [Andrographis paniculata]